MRRTSRIARRSAPRSTLAQPGAPEVATSKQVEAALGALLNSISRGSVVDRSTTTTEEFLADWLASQQHRLRATTLYSYEKAIERVTRRLGKVPLQALTPLQIEKFYAELLRDGARLGKPLSAKTARNSHVVLRKTLADAERLGLVYRNAAASARPPTAARKEFATWSSDDLREFFAGIRNVRMFPALCTPSDGRSGCASPSRRWVEPIVLANLAAPVHPNARGMAGAGAIVAAASGSRALSRRGRSTRRGSSFRSGRGRVWRR